MKDKLFKRVMFIVSFAFLVLDIGIMFIFQSSLRDIVDISYTKMINGFSIFILISFGLGIAAVIVTQWIAKRYFHK